jgi:Protein of unknown function (DUF3685)
MNELYRSVLSCLVIESDESCRWMLSFLLQNSGVAQIVAECESLEAGLVRLDALRATDRPIQVILLGSTVESLDALAPVVAAVTNFAPEAAIVVLGQQPASKEIASELGIRDYWWKLDRSELLLEMLSQLQPTPLLVKPSRVNVSPAIAALGRLSRQGITGLGEIDRRFAVFDRSLAQLDLQLRSGRLNRPARWLIQGRIREILTARWIAQQITPKPRSLKPNLPSQSLQKKTRQVGAKPSSSRLSSRLSSRSFREPSLGDRSNLNSQITLQGVNAPVLGGGALNPSSRRLSILFDQFIVKLDVADRSPLEALGNLGSLPMEMDLLTDELKVKLLMLTAQILQAEVEMLRPEVVGLAALSDRVPGLLDRVWTGTIEQFFQAEPDRIEPLLRSRPEVKPMLDRIPLMMDWIAYGLLEMPLTVENQPYAPGSPQADRRALLLLENTIFRVANAVLQPLLNQFSEVESVKARYFTLQYASSREMAKFRNDLSWRYRRDRWLDQPTDIFESQYRVLHLSSQGILETKLYAPRQRELQDLTGFPLIVTLALETKDAITPRLRSIVSFVGTGVVYFLTEVMGRGIGLVGQGIVKGIGNAWQERR